MKNGRGRVGSSTTDARNGARPAGHAAPAPSNGSHAPAPSASSHPVEELLAEFTATGSEAAFAEVVRRYAAMVFSVCLRVTKNAHDAEDATQATFLTLAVQCKSTKPVARLSAWLNQVAKRAALDVRRGRKRRETHEQRHADRERYDAEARLRDEGRNGHIPHGANGSAAGAGLGGPTDIDLEKLNAVLAEELGRLPAKYRMPLLSLYFGGMTRQQIAAELGLTVATLGVRIHRGRQMLARRLSDRGVAPVKRLLAGGVLAAAIATIAKVTLAERTAAAAAKMALGQDLVAVTTQGVLAAIRGSAAASILAKLKVVAAVTVCSLIGVTAATAGAGVVTADDLLALEQRLPQPVRNVIRALTSPWKAGPLPLPRPAQPSRFSPPVVSATSTSELPDSTLITPATDVVAHAPPAPPAARTHVTPPPAATTHSGGGPLRIASSPSGATSRLPAPRPQRSIPAAVAAAGTAQPPPRVTSRADVTLPRVAPAAAASAPAPNYVGEGAFALVGPHGGRWESLSVGIAPGTDGRFRLDGGVFHTGSQVIGGHGTGTFRQPRGWNITEFLVIGAGPTGSGLYDLDGGTIVVAPPGSAAVYAGAPAPPPGTPGGIHVGGEGSGALHLGGNGHGGGGSIIQPRGPNSPRPIASATPGGPPANPIQPSLVVRNEADGSGLIRGFGSAIGDGGTFENNGQVIADAGGQFRSLIFLGYSAVTSTIENGPGGHNGWFARGGGRLVLPKIVTAPGTHTYTWGEDALDPTLDLVNSARITLYDAQNPAKLDISLMDKTRPEVPSLPKGHTFIGVWSMDTGIARPAGADLEVRYDDGLAAQLGLNEASLKLWRYDATTAQWQRINDGSFARDMENNILSGHAEGPTSFFAVSAPEPSALGVLAIAGIAALRRRRRS